MVRKKATNTPGEGKTNKRAKIPIDVRMQVLHESGYMCANPCCRTILTLDIHHMVYIGTAGTNSAENLLPLCPNCHTRHHRKMIPLESIRAWKMLLLALNQAFDRQTINSLLALDRVESLAIQSDSVLSLASLIAAGLVYLVEAHYLAPITSYVVRLSEKGKLFVKAWKEGDQKQAVQQAGKQTENPPAVYRLPGKENEVYRADEV